jgi:hypothetical protein
MPFSALLPWRRLSLDTAWSPADVERELGFLLTGPQEQEDDVAWNGSRWPGGFRLTLRAAPGSRRPRVIASGTVQPMPTGSHILMTIRLPVAITSALLLAIPILVLLSAAVSVAALVRNEGVALLVWTLPLVLWPAMARTFLSEVNSAAAFLRKFFPLPAPLGAGPFR